ncbi:MAG TPA: glycosyl hydrolase family 79 C-terminal domain-containing protein [Solirubrobacteraceae bacterium]|nr:glycosyl hydrolase family 79 C-terminal domain-containing protein [Solirubrobacteraceae bacterium]
MIAISACATRGGATSSQSLPPGAITVSHNAVSRPVPGGFLGLSMEYRGLAAYAGTDPRAIDPPFLNLLRAIAPDQHPVLRVGGDSTDWTWWPVPGMRRPGGVKLDLTPDSMAVTRAVATDLGAKLILGINMEADSTRVAGAEARAFVQRVGAGSIAALEIGNEAELYPAFNWYRTAAGVGVRGRPPGYGFSGMIGDFSRMAAVMPRVALAGPSSGSAQWLPDLSSFLAREPRVRVATVHAYPLKHCSGSAPVTEDDLLSSTASDGLAATVEPWVVAAHRAGRPLRLDEMNAITCGGTRGISDTYGSALWALDTMFAMARAGVDGVNVHTVPGTINEILGPVFAHGHWSVVVHPEFYGLMMFAQAVPPGSQLIGVGGTPPPGVKVWAVRAPDRSIRVVVINKLSRRAMTIPVSLGAGHGPATVLRLQGRSLFATRAVTLGGQSFGAATTTGKLGAPQLSSLAPSGGVYSISVPAASAALVTVPAK